MKFLLDANFLTLPGQFKVDVFSDLKQFDNPDLYTLDLVVKELETIKSKHAKLGLELLKKHKVKILHATGNTDKAIVSVAKDGGFVVCTQDKKLISELQKIGVDVVFLRQKRLLEKK